MERSKKFLILVSITVLVLLTLLGSIVSASAGSTNTDPTAGQTLPGMEQGGQVPETTVTPDAGQSASPGGDQVSTQPSETTDGNNATAGGTGASTVPADASAECTSPKGKICGTKYLKDENGNKSPMGGVKILLGGHKTDYQMTASNGQYCFSNLETGTYTVSEEVPAGTTQITPSSGSYTVNITSCNLNHSGLDFINQEIPKPKGSISGHKWQDNNWDGKHQPGEPGMQGIEIRLKRGSTVIASTMTGADGSYSFSDLEPGQYAVEEVVPSGMKAASPTSVNVTLGQGQVLTGVDFINFWSYGVVSVVVYMDSNCNGQADFDGSDELVTIPVTVELYQVIGENLIPADGYDGSFRKQTGAGVYPPIWWPWVTPYPSGCAGWNNLPVDDGGGAAWYELKLIVPDGYYALDDTVRGPFALKPGIFQGSCAWWHQTFLLSPKFSITGHKWEDGNEDGKHQADEPPVEGVSIQLWQNGQKVAQTTTAADGSYSFTGLEAGIYTVKEIVPAGWSAEIPEDGVYEDVHVGCGDVKGLDFLNVTEKGSIHGVKYVDTDADGQYEPGSPGFPGVTIQLKQGAAVVKTTTTGADGKFAFTDVAPGTYDVAEVLDAGVYTKTSTIISGVTVASGQDVSLEDKPFLNYRKGSIRGWKYWDKNQNEMMDAGDQGLDGITIILTPHSGPEVTTVTSDGGYFEFKDLDPGTYTVSVDESTALGYYPTSLTSADVTVQQGEQKTVYFSEAPYGSISGHKWLDANANGLQDQGEGFLAGITINLYKEGNPETLVGSRVTGDDGSFAFTLLEPGTYRVAEEQKASYFATTASSVDVQLEQGGQKVVDFGNCQFGRIQGLKFNDLNGDSIQDTGEHGLQGVQVTLTGTNVSQTTVTGADGSFFFDNLVPGKYTVAETVPAGYYATRPTSIEVVVETGDTVKVTFSNCEYGKITGNKYLDDGDNTLDPLKDKPGPGITIKLSGTTLRGAMVSMNATTGEDGSYAFTLLEAGTYEVSEEFNASKYTAISPTSDSVVLAPGGEETVDFLNSETTVLPQPPITPEESAVLPRTGMNQLPLLIAGAIMVLLGLALLYAGRRRRVTE